MSRADHSGKAAPAGHSHRTIAETFVDAAGRGFTGEGRRRTGGLQAWPDRERRDSASPGSRHPGMASLCPIRLIWLKTAKPRTGVLLFRVTSGLHELLQNWERYAASCWTPSYEYG